MDYKLRHLNSMFAAVTSTAKHVLQCRASHTNLFHQDQIIFITGSLEGPPVSQLRNPFPYSQGRIAEIVQSLLSGLPLSAQSVGWLYMDKPARSSSRSVKHRNLSPDI